RAGTAPRGSRDRRRTKRRARFRRAGDGEDRDQLFLPYRRNLRTRVDIMTPNPPTNLLGLDRQGLQAFMSALGEKPFRGPQVMQWMHQYGAADFAAMTNLSKALRARLTEAAVIVGPIVKQDQIAADGTRK